MENIKNKKGLSITMIFKGQSLNYGEGIGNISELKKLTRGDGSVYTFASRQAIRYDIVRLGNKLFNWNLQVVNKEKGTIQFDDKLTIQDSEEMDLFGYMKTAKNDGSNIRSAAVRLSNAISLEDYKSDMEFLNNKGLADRIGEFPNLANIEQHPLKDRLSYLCPSESPRSSMPPDCVYIDSPGESKSTSTAGIVFPTNLYCITPSLSAL